MKPLDVVVLCKIFRLQQEGIKDWTYTGLAKGAALSVGETHNSVKRLKKARLLDALNKSVIVPSMYEFLVHGVKYAFPAVIGASDRGVPTAHSAPVLKKDLVHSADDRYVWSSAKGNQKGLSITPLSKSTPRAALNDTGLYALLALIDAIRVGKAREKKIAANKLKQILKP